MNSKEIRELHKKLDEATKFDTNNQDELLFQMSQSAGWEIFENKALDMCSELLEPTIFDDSVPLEIRGSINDAKAFALNAIRKLIGVVQSTKLAKIDQAKSEPPEAE